jgi:hypothetical protein
MALFLFFLWVLVMWLGYGHMNGYDKLRYIYSNGSLIVG